MSEASTTTEARRKPAMRVEVCASGELAPGQMVSTQLGPMPVVVIRAPDGSLHAVLDKCLHQGGPLSKGRLGADSSGSRDVGEYLLERDGEIIRCPWHGFEYDIRTGCALAEPSRCLRTFTAIEDDGTIFVSL